MAALLRLKPLNSSVEQLYQNGCTFHQGDAGFDIYCPENVTVPGKAISFKIPLGIVTALSINNLARSYFLFPRSSMGAKTPLRLSNSVGIIDSGYRGEITAIVDNISSEAFTIKSGERYFQLCAADLSPMNFQLVSELDSTERGSGGFGSTGV